MNPIFRKAKHEDAEMISEFNIKMAAETEGKKLDEDLVLKGVKAVIEDPDKGFYVVADKGENEPEIIGQMLVTFEWSDWRNKFFWWIQSVYVDQNYRHQRIFSNLHSKIMQIAKSNKDVCGLRLYVKTNNELAKKVYDALGMNKTSYEVYEEAL